jgi:acetyl esterase/lipase
VAIISEKDQAIVNGYNKTVQVGFANSGPGTPLNNIPVYRKVMADIDDNYLAPPKFVATPVASFQAERVLRPNLTAAVSVPKGSGPFPILVHAHGHGLRAGHPNKYEPWIRLMSSYGFVVVFPDYRLQPESTYEDQVDDMNFAIQWAKDNARDLKGNPDRMILGGDSAGGRMAFDVMMRHLDNAAGARFRAFICVDGQMNGPEADAMLEKLTPQTPLPPIYMEAGSADTNAGQPVVRFALKLMQLRKDFQLDCSYGMPHDFIKMPQMDAAKESNRRMMEFLKKAV